ncbi:2277_t:CDS:1 [Funneliformis caledonium]|uniref:2277_t:CDS:1 n=1 Tax=Funneliformis caledonium TaxID=1117310 RepID=A0A9N9CSZ7_9GLOM|nr:2277_t:CDS:1 [Funneliformis caledonium]
MYSEHVRINQSGNENVTEVLSSQPTSNSPYTITAADRFKVRIYFLRGWGNNGTLPSLPYEIIEVIFDFAQYWPSVTYRREDPYSGYNLNTLYLTGSLPSPPSSNEAEIFPKCKMVEFTCESHDQGWSSYPNDQGTYRGSYTWGEASVIIPKQGINLQDQSIDINDKFNEKVPIERHNVYTNKHADNTWQIHNNVFASDHPLVTGLQPGEMVGLWIRSSFPGWVNYIKRAELKLYYSF